MPVADARHVVLMTTDFHPMSGGVAEYLDQVAESLSATMPVTVMTTVAQSGPPRPRAYRLVPLAPLPQRRLGERAGDGLPPIRKLNTAAYFAKLRRHAASAVRAAREAAGSRPAFAIGIWDVPAHFWCEALQREGTPYVLFAYGVDLLVPLYGRLPGWRRHDFRTAARIVAVSTATADLARERMSLPRQPAIAHPSAGAPPAPAAVNERAARLREELGLTSAPVLLSVGRLVARKGFDRVVRATADLRDRFPGLRVVIAGDGPEREALETLARDLRVGDRVRFPGRVDDLTKWALYAIADLFVMPNRSLDGRDWEGFGIVFLEAAVAGRATVAGRHGGVADAVVDGVTGLLVDPEDQDALTACIEHLLADGNLRYRMGRAGAERAQTAFTGPALAGSLRTQLGWN